MYSELQCTPGWTDLDIFKIAYDEYMAFSRQYMAGQVAPGAALDADVEPLLGIATNARSCSWTSIQKLLLCLPN
jgi:hypothetical protein